MSGPHGTDPTQPWQPPQGEGQRSGEDQTQQASPWQQHRAVTRAGRPRAASSRLGRHPRTRLPSTASTSSRPPPTTRRRRRIRRPTLSRVNTPARPPPTASRPASTVSQASRVNMVSQVSTVSRSPVGPQPGQYGQYGGPYGQPPAGPKRSKKTIGTVLGLLAADRRRGDLGAGLLGAGILRHHQARRR